MRWTCLLLVAACGNDVRQNSPIDAPADAAPDAPTPADPFAGMFDEPSDFPHTNCTLGSLAGFSRVELWDSLGLRTQLNGGALETFVSTFLDEEQVGNLLTADDLLVRHSYFDGQRWSLRAMDICAVGADGTVHGTQAYCSERPPDSPFPPCSTFPFDAAPFRRIAGESEGSHLALLGELGSAWPKRVGGFGVASSNVRVDGDVAFVTRFGDGLRIVSILNPAAPVELGHIAFAGDYANDLKIVRGNDGRRYVITASFPANIIDATDPANPQLAAQLTFSPHSIFIEGTLAYLVDGATPAVDVWDVSAPRTPVRLASFEHPERTAAWHDIFVTGGMAYLSDINGSGLHVVDFRNPASPVVVGGEDDIGFSTMWHTPWLTTVGGKKIAIDGTEFSSPGFRLLDGDPASPELLKPLGNWSLLDGATDRRNRCTDPVLA